MAKLKDIPTHCFIQHCATIICLFMASSLFAQQQEQQLEWKKNNYISETYSLDEQGTAYIERDGLQFTRVNYFSADGKTFWKSKKTIKQLSYRGGCFSDKTGFTVYDKPLTMVGNNRVLEFIRFDYAGNMVEDGKQKFDYPVISHIQSDGKFWVLMESVSNDVISADWLTTLYLQEIDPKNLKPLGEPQKIDLPAKKYEQHSTASLGNIKGTVAFYWTLAGYDEKTLLFYGKRTDMTAGKVSYEFVKTDFSGKKLEEFNVEILLENAKFVNRTVVQKNINETSEAYTSSSAPGSGYYGSQTIDPGNFGGCHVDWQQKGLYFYGCYGNEPDYARTKVAGYFIQKFSLSGKNIWRYQTKDDVISPAKKYEPWWPTHLIVNNKTGRVILFDFPVNVFSLDSTGLNAEFYSYPAFQDKKDDEKKGFYAGVANTYLQPHLYALQHSEIMTPTLPQSILGTQAVETLQTFLEKNGHTTSTYMIQQNKTTFQVLEMDLKGKMFRFWTLGY